MLTANHCIDYESTSVTVTYAYGTAEEQTAVVPEASIYRYPGNVTGCQGVDALLLKLPAPFTISGSTDRHHRAMYPRHTWLLNGPVRTIGYGLGDDPPVCNQTYRDVTIDRIDYGLFNAEACNLPKGDMVTWNEENLLGHDSGGGGFVEFEGQLFQATIHAGGENVDTATSTPFLRGWIASTMFLTPGEWWDANIQSSVGTSSPGENVLDVFFVNDSDVLKWRRWDSGWKSNRTIPTSVTPKGTPDAVSRGPDRIDLVYRGVDNQIYHCSHVGDWSADWDACELLANSTGSESHPTIASWGPERLDVFYRQGDQLKHHWCAGTINCNNHSTGWGYEYRGTGLAGKPDAVSWGPLRIDVVSQGTDGTIQHLSYDWNQGGWDQGELGYGYTSASPAIASWAPQRLDVFTVNSDGSLRRLWYDHTWSSYWEDIPTSGMNAGVSAVSSRPGRIDVFSSTAGSTNDLRHTYYPVL